VVNVLRFITQTTHLFGLIIKTMAYKIYLGYYEKHRKEQRMKVLREVKEWAIMIGVSSAAVGFIILLRNVLHVIFN